MTEKSYITGIGGVFFKCPDIDKTRNWYRDTLGFNIDDSYGGTTFEWHDKQKPERVGRTIWSPFKHDTEYFGPGNAEFMINYRVSNLDDLLADLKTKGVEHIGDIEDEEYGRFAWINDPDGRRIELWEPKGEPLREAG